MKKMKIVTLLAIMAFGNLNAAMVEIDGVKHYIPDSAINVKEDSLKAIPHMTEENGVLSVINNKGIPISITEDKDIDPSFKENFKRIFSMQTGGERKVDLIVLVRPVPNTNIKLVVYVLNGVIIPAYATHDGKAMFRYSPIVNGHGINRFDYAYMKTIISRVSQMGIVLSGEGRYAKLALSLKDNKYIYRLHKGKVTNGEYYFADPLCPICKSTLEQMKKSKNYDKTIVLIPAMRANGIESIMRSASILQELTENNITNSDDILNVMLNNFGKNKQPTGAFPDKKYVNIVRDMMKEYLPATQNQVPFEVSYKTIKTLQDKIAFTDIKVDIKKLKKLP